MPTFGRGRLPVAIVLSLAAFATAGRCAEREPIKFPDTQYEPVEWASLDGWATDDHAAAFATFLQSCRALNGGHQAPAESSTIADALRSVCLRAVAAVPLEEDGARKFFEDNFRPLRIAKLGDSEGFLTG
jgi:membrane-bound lytic murein transglycosylase A